MTKWDKPRTNPKKSLKTQTNWEQDFLSNFHGPGLLNRCSNWQSIDIGVAATVVKYRPAVLCGRERWSRGYYWLPYGPDHSLNAVWSIRWLFGFAGVKAFRLLNLYQNVYIYVTDQRKILLWKKAPNFDNRIIRTLANFRVVFDGGGEHVLVTEYRGMALNGLVYADVLRPLDLVPLTDFTYIYHPQCGRLSKLSWLLGTL